MAPRKSERLVNLTICLLAARRYVSKEDLRRMITGYHGLSDDAFERQFERDKEELRALGVPVDVGSNSALHEDEVGYRIRRSDFELPAVELTRAESTAVALAAHMWTEATMAEHTASALAKLRSVGAEPDAARLAALTPAAGSGLAGPGGGFDTIRAALRDRRRVRFTYRDGSRRTVEPWLVNFRHGAWYLTGFDIDRGAERMFRLNRIRGDVEAVGDAASYDIPGDTALKAVQQRLAPATEPIGARVAVRRGAGGLLRRAGRVVEATETEQVPDGFDVLALFTPSLSMLAADVASLGEDAHVLAPTDLREAVIARLLEVAR